MNNLSTLGRIAFAVPMIIFGLAHFMFSDHFAAKLPVSNAYFLIYLTGLVLMITGSAIVLNKKVKPAALLLSLVLVMFALVIHLSAVINGQPQAYTDLLKDFGLAGAALYLSATAKD